MLAKIEDAMEKRQFVSDRQYDGFPTWNILRVKSSKEAKAARILTDQGAPAYLPTFNRLVRSRGHAHRWREYAAIPGLLFIPESIVSSIKRRAELFDLAGVFGFVTGTEGREVRITKADVELVRLLEAKLNLPPESKGHLLKIGQQVRFKDHSQWYPWGGGTVIELVDATRIRVEVPGLFGRATRVTVPADEVEAK